MTEAEHIRRVRSELAVEERLPDEALDELAMVIRIMHRLRAPGGCPWDRVQTHESLLKNLIEEAYEFVDTVHNGDDEAMREELGDFLMQVVFQAEIAGEGGAFTIADVARDLADKLIRRHPHVFGDRDASTPEQALESWNVAKKKEGDHRFSLDGIPKGMPALLRARKVQEKAAKVGFDWDEHNSAIEKMEEELAEFKETVESGDRGRAGEELGDLLFAVVNVARYVKHCPEVALTATVDKFQRRFRHIERRLAEEGRSPSDSTLEEMDVYWDEAKELERSQSRPRRTAEKSRFG